MLYKSARSLDRCANGGVKDMDETGPCVLVLRPFLPEMEAIHIRGAEDLHRHDVIAAFS
jgi:hypothetical protein